MLKKRKYRCLDEEKKEKPFFSNLLVSCLIGMRESRFAVDVEASVGLLGNPNEPK